MRARRHFEFFWNEPLPADMPNARNALSREQGAEALQVSTKRAELSPRLATALTQSGSRWCC
jgi:hypothetical protein